MLQVKAIGCQFACQIVQQFWMTRIRTFPVVDGFDNPFAHQALPQTIDDRLGELLVLDTCDVVGKFFARVVLPGDLLRVDRLAGRVRRQRPCGCDLFARRETDA